MLDEWNRCCQYQRQRSCVKEDLIFALFVPFCGAKVPSADNFSPLASWSCTAISVARTIPASPLAASSS